MALHVTMRRTMVGCSAKTANFNPFSPEFFIGLFFAAFGGFAYLQARFPSCKIREIQMHQGFIFFIIGLAWILLPDDVEGQKFFEASR